MHQPYHTGSLNGRGSKSFQGVEARHKRGEDQWSKIAKGNRI